MIAMASQAKRIGRVLVQDSFVEKLTPKAFAS